VDPVPDPLLLRKKSGSAGNRTRVSGSVARKGRSDASRCLISIKTEREIISRNTITVRLQHLLPSEKEIVNFGIHTSDVIFLKLKGNNLML
jgi:hypothetical protein